jgi:hypothetical protein
MIKNREFLVKEYFLFFFHYLNFTPIVALYNIFVNFVVIKLLAIF